MHAEYDVNGLSACEQEQIARQLFYPKSGYEMHVSLFLIISRCTSMPGGAAIYSHVGGILILGAIIQYAIFEIRI